MSQGEQKSPAPWLAALKIQVSGKCSLNVGLYATLVASSPSLIPFGYTKRPSSEADLDPVAPYSQHDISLERR